MTVAYKKKLIEVALPLQAINEGSKPETENPFLKGHPRAVHNWWARTPLSVSRAILFAQLIDDPGDGLPPEEARIAREGILKLVADLATWEATTDGKLLKRARELIRKQFNGEMPEFWDMFGGRASIPLEAQRLGLKVTSSDLNPVAVTIQRALLEYPARFRGRPPVHPQQHAQLIKEQWQGANGLAEDVHWYGEWVRQEAAKRLNDVYPKGAKGRSVSAWLWVRAVQCPNPGCAGRTPLVGSFVLSKKGECVHVAPEVNLSTKTVDFTVRRGGEAHKGTSSRSGAVCLFCKTPINKKQLRATCMEHGIEIFPFAMVLEGNTQDRFLPFGDRSALDLPVPDVTFLQNPMTNDRRWFSPPLYGMPNFADLFTPRQLRALSVLCDTITQARQKIASDSKGDTEYADAVTVYLACALSRLTDYQNSLCTWNPTNENVAHLFQRQAIPIVWDFAEANPINGKLSYAVAADWVAGALACSPLEANPARVLQFDARKSPPHFGSPPVVSTDPPYYDNIGYADLADFFYVWLRPMLKDIDAKTFSTLLTPKDPELIASPHRHNGSAGAAEKHFRDGFLQTFGNTRDMSRHDIPLTVYYAFKQEEDHDEDDMQRASTGWETMLEGLIDAGFRITGTWPVRTTKKARAVAIGTNALASAIVLVARQRPKSAPKATRRDFLAALKKEMAPALSALTQANIAPVDLAQASIGPGMAIYSRYSSVIESDGSLMSVRTALALINQIKEEVIGEPVEDYDPETRWAVAWFDQNGFAEGEYGVAEVLATAQAVAIGGLRDAGLVQAKGGKVRLLRPEEMPKDWDPAKDKRLTVWEMTHHLLRLYYCEKAGDHTTANLRQKLGSRGDVARDLAYRLFSISERRNRSQDALGYNALVLGWPELSRLSRATPVVRAAALDLPGME
jgi:putative DNA methylase